MKLNLYYATINHYRAQAQEALAAMEMYLNEPVAIGGHSNFTDEIKKWTEQLAAAEGAIASLNKYFGAQVEAAQAPPPGQEEQ